MEDARLLVVDNALDHKLYRPVEHWAEMTGFTPDSVYVPGGGPLPDVDRYSHVIISGCEGSIMEMPDWATEEAKWLDQVIDAGTSVLGSCWGHQLIAFALAGPAAVRRASGPEFGWVELPISTSGGILPDGSFQTFTAHFDEVVVGCHPELRVLSSSAECAVQAARWGDLPVWGIQPHPEISPGQGRGFLEKAAAEWPAYESLFETALNGPVRDSGAGKTITRDFLGYRSE